MKNRLILSLFFILIGLLLILVPLYILPVCPPPELVSMPSDAIDQHAAHSMQHGTGKIMKCFWTARAEIGIGSVVIAIGLLMHFTKNAFIRMGLSMSLACIALLAAAIPLVLIGVCGNEMMRCNMGTKPALVLLSGLLFVVAVINTFYLNKTAKKF